MADPFERVRLTAVHIADMIDQGWDLSITHGNGPQVGSCLLRAELAAGALSAGFAELCSQGARPLGNQGSSQVRDMGGRHGIRATDSGLF